METIYRDRRDAGRRLAEDLSRFAGRRDVTVLALPRGGVPVAFEAAVALDAPLDVFIVRKLGFPGQEEFAFGAIASGGERVLNEDVMRRGWISPATIEAVAKRELVELERRERDYRAGRPPLDVRGRCVILVDDGLATGSTMRAAVRALRRMGPSRIVVAVPTAAPDTCRALRADADEVVCAMTPEPFHAVGLWYRDFEQTGDEEVRRLLAEADSRVHGGAVRNGGGGG